MKYLKTISLLILLHHTFYMFGQSDLLVSESFSIKEGLSQGYISAVVQDEEGFLWIGTKNGLNRFDGKQFKIFRYDPFDLNSISDDYITDIHLYKDFLVLSMASGGLNIFNRKNYKVYRLPFEGSVDGSKIAKSIRNVVVDQRGNIWFLSQERILAGHVFKVELTSGFWENIESVGLSESVLSVTQFSNLFSRDIYINRDGDELFFESPRTIYAVDIHTEKVTVTDIGEPFHFQGVLQAPNGKICLSTDHGIYYYDSGELTFTPSNRIHKYILSIDKQGKYIIMDHDNNICYYSYDKKGNEFIFEKIISHCPTEATTALIDWTNNIWIGTGGYGLLKISPFEPFIEHLFEGNSVYSTPYHNVAKNEFTFFTDPGGIISSIPNPSFPRGIFEWGLDNSNASHTRFLKGKDGLDWFMYHTSGDDHHYLLGVNQQGDIVKRIDPKINVARPGHFTQMDNGKLVLGINGLMAVVDPSDSSVEKYTYERTLNIGHDVRSIAVTEDEVLWIGTNQGIVKARPSSNGYQFSYMQREENLKIGLLSNDIGCLHVDEDSTHILWIGTKGKGLHRFNTRNREFEYIMMAQGLPDEVIYGILPDNNGQLWISTNNGLVVYKKATGDIKVFTPEDGLQDYEFNTWAYSKATDDILLFGGVNGLNVLYLDRVWENKIPPKPIITGLYVNNREVKPGEDNKLLDVGIPYVSDIRLSHKQSNLEFHFGALEFTNPSGNFFQYYLEGIEEPWIHEQKGHKVQYLNLSPGKYVFHLKAGNGDGYMSDEEVSLQIVIDPPWYKTWWAYCIYIFSAIVGIYMYVNFRINQVRLEGELIIEQEQRDKIEKIEAFKSKFYRNITHEFRTPLTLIKGVSNLLLDRVSKEKFDSTAYSGLVSSKDIQKDLQLIDKHSDRLLDLVNELLYLAKSKEDTLQLHLEYGQIQTVIESLIQSFFPAAKMKNVTIQHHYHSDEHYFLFDKHKLEHVLENLLSNALKFSRDMSYIDVITNIYKEKDKYFIKLEVKDEGPGIPKDDLEKVFLPYYQVSRTTHLRQGTGLGLSYCKELVQAMGGTIWAENRPDGGSIFLARWPVEPMAENFIIENTNGDAIGKMSHNSNGLVEDNPESEEQKPIVLIVEDNEDIRTFIIDILKKDYQVLSAKNGQEGVELAFKCIPDIIISDIMMPVMDGHQLSQIIKTDLRTDHIPLIFLSAKSSTEQKMAGYASGVDIYLTKPFLPGELASIVSGLLENRQRLQEHFKRNFSSNQSHVVTRQDSDKLPLQDDFIIKLNDFLKLNYQDEGLNVEGITTALSMSRANLHRKVKSVTGLSISGYINLYRIEQAKIQMMNDDSVTIAEIAYSVGYTDPKYFSRVFTDQVGKSPILFRSTFRKEV